MKKYYVEVPITGKIMAEVKANSKQEAIDIVLENQIIEELEKIDGVEFAEWEWNAIEKVVQGNVFYGELNRAYAEEQKDEEED